MDRLTIPKVGDGTSAKWAKQVVDEIRRQEIIPGNGLKKTVTVNGTVLSLDIPKKTAVASGESPDPAVDSCFPVTITSYTSGQAYTGCKFMVAGSTSISNSDFLYFPHVAPSTRFPTGCTVLAHRIETQTIASANDSNR